MVEVAFSAGSAEVESSIGLQVQRPDLVRAGHSDHQSVSVDRNDVPRWRQFLLLRQFIAFFVVTFFTCSYYCQHFSASKVDFSDRMVLGVAKVDEVLLISVDVAEALWMVEACFFKWSVDQPNQSLRISNDVLTLHRICVDQKNTVVSCIWNNEKRVLNSILFFNANNIARKLQILGLCSLFLFCFIYSRWNLLFFLLQLNRYSILVV